MDASARNPVGGGRRERRVGGLLVLTVFLIDLLAMPRTVLITDASKWRREATNLLLDGRLWIDPSVALRVGERGQYFVLNPVNGRYYSKYGIVNSLMSMPPMIAERLWTGKFPSPTAPGVLFLNLWNILLNCLLAWVLFVVAGRYAADPWRRAAFVMGCLYATYLWYYQRAQESDLYHALFFAAAFECLLRGLEGAPSPRRRWLLAAWVFIGLMVLARVFYGILIFWMIGVCVGAMIRRGQSIGGVLPVLFIPPVVILALLGWINTVKFGSPYSSGYEQWRPEDHLPTQSWIDGVWGLLFSCHWSILVYCPLIYVALPGVRRFMAEHPLDGWAIFSAMILTLVMLGKIPTWRGEWDYGPRYLIFLAPLISLPALLFGEGFTGGRSGAAGWTALGVAAVVLGFSALLQVVMIRADFSFFYHVEAPLDGRLDRETSEYLFDRHEALLFWDLYSHRRNLDETFLFRQLRRQAALTPAEIEAYRQAVLRELDQMNLYWWPQGG